MKSKFIAALLVSLSTLALSACSSGPTDTTPLTLGSPDASVLVEEFSDVQCPACRQISPQVEEVIRANSDIARLSFYHFPLSYHEHAMTGAQAVECAADQGKVWEYLADTFRNGGNLSDSLFTQMAGELGLDTAAFDECLDSGKYRGKVLAHLAEGRRRRVPGTPTLFVNGQMVKWPGAEQFEAYLKSLSES